MKKIMILSALAMVITSCASIPVNPEAKHMIVSPHRAPKGCRYLGPVFGNQGNFFTGGFTSNRNLEEGAMNDMRNQAARLGANYIHLMTNRAGVIASSSAASVGNAFYCSRSTGL